MVIIDHAFLIPGVLLGAADSATFPSMESTYQLQNTVAPGGQIFSIRHGRSDQLAGDRWNLIVVLRTTDPTQLAGTIAGFKVSFNAPWHVALTDTSHTGVAFDPSGRCGTP